MLNVSKFKDSLKTVLNYYSGTKNTNLAGWSLKVVKLARLQKEKEIKYMLSFEEYVMFSSLSDSGKKELAEGLAEKFLTAKAISASTKEARDAKLEEINMAKTFGLSYAEIWAQQIVKT